MPSQDKKLKKKKNKDCEHNFLAVIHCKKCGEQFHINWLEALVEVKLNAVEEILRRVKTTVRIRSKGVDQEKAIKIAQDAFSEVREVYEKARKTLGPKN
jgi:predicted nucleic acid-binding protein